MKRFLTKYSTKLPRTITYMLQASEYIIPEYLIWLKNIKDFRSVEKRKKLTYTKKSILILFICYLIILSSITISYYFYSNYTGSAIKFIIPIIILIITPQILSYLILIPLFLVKILIQKPIEYLIIEKAKKILEENRAIKIAIAGSYGKTSMKEILKTILSEKFVVAAPKHSYNTPLGISRFINSLNGKEDILIFELGEYYPNDIKKLCILVKPEVGIITGINQAHFQKFKSIEKTVETIFELSDYLKDKKVFINAESKIANEHSKKKFIRYSKYGCEDIKITNTTIDISGTEFFIEDKYKKVKTKTNLLGAHQLGPIAVAAKIAIDNKMEIAEVANAIRKTKPFEHRLEPIKKGSDIIILDDTYNGNPDGVSAIIDFIKNIKNRRKIYITPGLVEMGEESEKIHEKIGESLASAGIDKIVLIKNTVTPTIEKGLKKANYKGEIIWFEDSLIAHKSLDHITIKGDLVIMQNDWPDQYY